MATIALTFAAALMCQALPGASINGIVVDRDGGAPLAGVSVAVEGTARAAATDRRGRFTITGVAAGRQTLRVSLIGFGLVRRSIDVEAGVPIDLRIVLAEGADAYSEEVVVRSGRFEDREPSVPAQLSLGSAEIQTLGNLSINDPLRAVHILPGVTAGDDFRSEFAVRGSDFGHMQFTFEGVPTTVLLHTVHETRGGGSVAMINGAVLGEVTLLSGSYPQRFGNRLGAALDFRMREGSRDRTRGQVSVSGTEAWAVAEGPFGSRKAGSWLVSARRSYLDFLLERLTDKDPLGFTFSDVQGKVVYDVTPRHRVEMSVVAGTSELDQFEYYPNPLGGRNTSQLATAAWRFTPSGSAVLTQRIAVAANQFTNRIRAGDVKRGHAVDLMWRADASLSAGGFNIEAGSAVTRRSMRAEDDLLRARPARYGDSGIWSSAFVQARWLNARARVTGGARVDHWTLTNDLTASPWLLGELSLGRGMTLRAGASVHHQAPDFGHVLGPKAGDNLAVERAYHADIGVEQAIGRSGRWRVTVYNREERDRLRLWASEPRIFGRDSITAGYDQGPWQTALDGYARGIELLLQRRSAGGPSGWISYSYAHNRYRDHILDESFDGDLDQRHTFNAYGTWRLTGRTSAAARLRVGSNTPVSGYFEERDGLVYVTDVKNRVRLPHYSRLDLRVSRTFALGRSRLTLFVEVVNALDRENMRAALPVIDVATRRAFSLLEPLLPRLPSAGLTIEF